MPTGRNCWTRLTENTRRTWCTGPDGQEQLLLEGKIWAKPSRHRPAASAPRRYSRKPQHRPPACAIRCERLKDMDLEGIDTAVNFGTTVFLSLPFLEDHDLGLRHRAWLTTPGSTSYCKTRPATLEGRCAGGHAGAARSRQRTRTLRKELGFVAVATLPAIRPDAIWIILISIRSTPKPRNSACPYAFMSARAGRRLPPSASTIRYFVHATTHAFEQMIGVMCIVGGGILEALSKVESRFSRSRRRLGALLDGAFGRAL